jgi:hypothetical protein
MSAEGRRFLALIEPRALLFALACTACFSIDFLDTEPRRTSPARFIETFCKQETYELEGSAERTTGLTNDSCGFSVGPESGAVRFVVERSELAPYSYYSFEALLAAKDGSNGHWLELAETPHGTSTVAFAVSPQSGKQTRVVDVRLDGQLVSDSGGCSIARGRRGSLTAGKVRF